MIDQIYSHHEMCSNEGGFMLQKGMNFKVNGKYSIILMSQRVNAPYQDKILEDGVSIEYEGHDCSRRYCSEPKNTSQPEYTPTGSLTENGKFKKAVDDYKNGLTEVSVVKVYEKLQPGIWSLKGYFDLLDYKIVMSGMRSVFRFTLKLSESMPENFESNSHDIEHTRLIPSNVKRIVYKRDRGVCVICGSAKNLHYDHDLPYSKGGESTDERNIRLLCAKHNLSKSGKIE